jgi:DNA invertase Pin-like site-specific DNA recombinase
MAWNRALPERGPVRAAQYVRMSTTMQKYSIANQARVIQAYADEHGLEIVRSYEDRGRSGLTLKGRDGLQQLISDVQFGKPDFQAVLVYDVSRWGRFQNTDESAFYEYMCHRAGVRVVYCAEVFEDDGSPASLILKTLKRAMAAEYSRELSTKVHQGKVRTGEAGFRCGGQAPYGYQRVLVGRDGRQQVLRLGERKSLQSDKTILSPGASAEIETVRRIFRLFVSGQHEGQIADLLNREGVPGPRGGTWKRYTISYMLKNRTYIGDNVFQQSSSRFTQPRRYIPPSEWRSVPDAFEAIVTKDQFARAQKRIAERAPLNRDQALAILRKLLRKHGRLTLKLIAREGGIASTVITDLFGSALNAYERLGYRPRASITQVASVQRYAGIRADLLFALQEGLREQKVLTVVDCENGHLTARGAFRLRVVIGRCIVPP